jgi:hypothetical protein
MRPDVARQFRNHRGQVVRKTRGIHVGTVSAPTMEMASNESADRLIDIVNRLDALDRKLDDRFAAVDRRFEQVDQRFDKEHSFFMTLSEDSRSDFNNLYDFVRAQAEATDARFERLEAQHAIRFADIDTAISALMRRGTPPPRRRRR